MTHHPHVHMIVPGGGLSLDGAAWIRCRRPDFLLPVRVLSRLFRRLMLAGLSAAHTVGRLAFFGDLAGLKDARAFTACLAPLRKTDWFVYAKPPFAGPKAVLAYLSRYTHRVAISNHRLIAATDEGVAFRVKDYRPNGRERYRTMTLPPAEFIRRFMLHVLPKSFHRIRHYGLLAGATRKTNLAWARELLDMPEAEADVAAEATAVPREHRPPCPCCGGRMIIVETFARGHRPRAPPSPGPAVFDPRPLGRITMIRDDDIPPLSRPTGPSRLRRSIDRAPTCATRHADARPPPSPPPSVPRRRTRLSSCRRSLRGGCAPSLRAAEPLRGQAPTATAKSP